MVYTTCLSILYLYECGCYPDGYLLPDRHIRSLRCTSYSIKED